MSNSALYRIAMYKAAQVRARRSRLPEAELEAMARASPIPMHSFADAVRREAHQPLRIVAECKKASPSRGVLVQDYDPVALAMAYRQGGAAAISVLTETEWFLGADAHLRAVSTKVDLPTLRKDFTLNRYQLLEARCLGASAVLLIAALLPASLLRELTLEAAALNLQVLIEIHSLKEVKPALEAGPDVLGINNRNLCTFESDLGISFDLLPHIPTNLPILSESGISTTDQARRLREAGIHGLLVGEGVCTASDPQAAVQALRTA